MHAMAGERVVLPAHSPRAVVEFAEKQFVAARTLEICFLITGDKERGHPRQSCACNHGVFAAQRPDYIPQASQRRKIEHGSQDAQLHGR